MTLDQLEKLADAVYDPNKDDWDLKRAIGNFTNAANPATIKALIALVRLQNEALRDAIQFGQFFKDEHFRNIPVAIAAFEKFGREG